MSSGESGTFLGRGLELQRSEHRDYTSRFACREIMIRQTDFMLRMDPLELSKKGQIVKPEDR